MLTGKLSSALWRKLAAAPPGYFESAQGTAMVRKAAALIAEREGEGEAATFRNLCTVARFGI